MKQQPTAFSLASIQGNYAIATNGLAGATIENITGQIAANGSGVVGAGAIDINTGGTLTTGKAVAGSYLTPGSNGRATLVLNPTTDNRNFAVYIVNSTLNGQLQQVFAIGIDNGRLAAGNLLRQF
jgi:hypothetical protein